MKKYLKLLVVMAIVLPVAVITAACGGSKPLEGQYKIDNFTIKNVNFVTGDFDLDKAAAAYASFEGDSFNIDTIVAALKPSGVTKVTKLYNSFTSTEKDQINAAAVGMLYYDEISTLSDLLSEAMTADSIETAKADISAAVTAGTITQADGDFLTSFINANLEEPDSADIDTAISTYVVDKHKNGAGSDPTVLLKMGMVMTFASSYSNDLILNTDQDGHANYSQNGNSITYQGGDYTWNSARGTLTVSQSNVDEGIDFAMTMVYKRVGDVPNPA